MKKVKVITTAWPNKLEDQLNENVGKKGYELKAVYFDSEDDNSMDLFGALGNEVYY